MMGMGSRTGKSQYNSIEVYYYCNGEEIAVDVVSDIFDGWVQDRSENLGYAW